MLPTVFLKNKASIVLGEILLRLGKISKSFPKRALLLEFMLLILDDDVECDE